MALSITKIAKTTTGSTEVVVADITFDSSYATGGEALTASDLGLKAKAIDHLVATQKGVASRIAEYDYANEKLKLFTAISTEAANASDQSAVVVRVRAEAAYHKGV